jgi:hypothetical protein
VAAQVEVGPTAIPVRLLMEGAEARTIGVTLMALAKAGGAFLRVIGPVVTPLVDPEEPRLRLLPHRCPLRTARTQLLPRVKEATLTLPHLPIFHN